MVKREYITKQKEELGVIVETLTWIWQIIRSVADVAVIVGIHKKSDLRRKYKAIFIIQKKNITFTPIIILSKP